MVKICCVKNCDNRSTRESDRKYFGLPKAGTGSGEDRDSGPEEGEEEEGSSSKDWSLLLSRRHRWIEAIRGPSGDQLEVNDYYRVCSDHFHSGEPADDEDVNNIDWIPTVKMGHVTEGFDDDTEDLKSRWPNWEMFVKRILVFLKTGRHEDELTRPEQKAIQKAAKTYYLEGGVLFHQRSKKPLRVVMAESEHRDVIRQFHVMESGIHSGINATVDRITSKYFWRGIKQDVVQYISQCCGRHKDSGKQPAAKTQGDESRPDVDHANTTKSRASRAAAQKSPSSVSTQMLEESAMRLLEEYSQQLRGDRIESISFARPPERGAPDEEATILDEVEGSLAKVDRRRSTERETGAPTSQTKPNQGGLLPSSGFDGMPSDVMDKGCMDNAGDRSKNESCDNMTASAAMLRLMSSASKDKVESHPVKFSSQKSRSNPTKPNVLIAPKPSAPAVKAQTAPDVEVQSSTKHYRSFAWLLHNIGMRMVRQQVYKNLVEIQEVKNEQNRLDEGEKRQLEKLKGYYMDLKQKNRYLMGHGRRCRCGHRAGSMQELDLHQEYGHGWESGRYDCCLCKCSSKAFSMFSSHMVKEHGRKARFHLPMAPFVCPYCPFEHRHNTKKKLLRHVANCEHNFQLDCNLAVRAIDADIPLLAPPKSAVLAVSAEGSTSSTETPGNKARDPASPTAGGHRPGKPATDSGTGGQPMPVGSHPKAPQPPSPRYEVCEICGGFVKDRSSLVVHMKVAHKVDVHPTCKDLPAPPIECGSCAERFWTVQSRSTHVSLLHGEAKDPSRPPSSDAAISVCPLCKRTRLTDVMLHLAQQHRVTLLDMFLVRYCALCLLELHSEKAFEDHMTTSHGSLYPSRGELFRSIRSLEQQRLSNSTRPSALLLALVNRNRQAWKFKFNSCHNPLQLFSCPICRCQFGSLDDLTCHFERVHSHKCHRCEYRCGSASLLWRHFRKEHDSTERCPVCDVQVEAGVAMVAHFEERHLTNCSVSLSRTAALRETDVGRDIDILTSAAKRRHPSSLSDGSNEGSIYDEEEEDQDESKEPLPKYLHLEDSSKDLVTFKDL